MTAIERKLCALADNNFKRDLPSRLKKLIEEVGELAEAMAKQDYAETIMEAADVSFVLMDIAHISGGSLSAAQSAKWKIIMHRKRNGMLHKADRIKAGK